MTTAPSKNVNHLLFCFINKKVLRLVLMTTVILTMTDNVVKGFNHLPESSTFCFISVQASLTRTSVGHRTIEKSLVCGDSV